MKRLALIIFALLVLIVTGCDVEDYKRVEPESRISSHLVSERITRDGHSYLYFYDLRGGYDPVSVIHDPDCPCYNKQ